MCEHLHKLEIAIEHDLKNQLQVLFYGQKQQGDHLTASRSMMK